MRETGEVPGEQLDDEDMGALLASLVGEMPGLPAREVRDMVNQLGREAAIKTMAAMLSERDERRFVGGAGPATLHRVGRAGVGQAAAAGAAPMRAHPEGAVAHER